jgi:ubiquinol-cytochrome c reductase cytochrome b subunit
MNFNYWYGIGFLLLSFFVNQVISGVGLASYYAVSIDLAFSSCDYVMREVHYG